MQENITSVEENAEAEDILEIEEDPAVREAKQM